MNANPTCTCSTGTDESDDPGSACPDEQRPESNSESEDPDQPPPEQGSCGRSADDVIVEFSGAENAEHLDLTWLQLRIHAASQFLGQPVARVGIVLVKDERMAALHGEYRGEAVTTDVLTYELSEPGEPIDVDIVLCVDEATRQAVRRSHTVERELLLYGLHGMLHCAGFDDGDAESFKAMHRREDEILELIGVGGTFADDLSTGLAGGGDA